ncbi:MULTISPECIES: SIS domain-containing protein [Pacificibacter]|uniref:SIS domain-containing protein n=1 Tax=Pacificibacter TaxID=1042323 RepID=UPI001C087D78|nr:MULTISPECIES: SIS domain-containing protein [Pacificibacter]MBU2937166.1 SIS domain-containing protein [Pacificibacter marinus]MDO6617014.1 SIS domain-containing protein [Pacificibacter sp. 1_MG-2023]
MLNDAPNVLEVISKTIDTLRKSDRKVAEVILANPSAATQFKLAELARLAEVSEPTVVRFCNAVGCSGYQDFKIRLAGSLAFGLPSAHAEIGEDDTLPSVISKLFDFNLSSLDWVRSKLQHDALAEAAEAILTAKSLHFVGFGASSIVAMDAQQKFPLFGVQCQATVDFHQMLIEAAMMGEGDILVAISNSGTTREVAQCVKLAREQGALTIGLTGQESPISRYCDINILIETLENTDLYTPTISRVAALVVIDILSTYVALRRSPEHRAKIAEMKRVLSEFRSSGIL